MGVLRDRERQAAQRECGLLRSLNHAHIVQYVDNYEIVSAVTEPRVH